MRNSSLSIIFLSSKILFKNEHSYLAHPFCTKIDDKTWILVFNQTVRRNVILHPPEDPNYYNMISISRDEGDTWSTPIASPNFDWQGVECAGITVLRNGRILLNQWRFDWVPVESAREEHSRSDLVFPSEWGAELHSNAELPTNYMIPKDPEILFPWARGNKGCFIHLSDNGGKTWFKTIELITYPYSGGYGMRGAVQIQSGRIILPLSDVPNYEKVFTVFSDDDGFTWSQPQLIADVHNLKFEEPAIIALSDGDLLVLLRENSSRKMFQVRSSDNGNTWSDPEPNGIDGYPAHLLKLPNGDLLCTYGYRNEPFSIRAVVSRDQGKSWGTNEFITILGRLPNKNLGYPVTLMCLDGSFKTIYYSQNDDGTTSINSIKFKLLNS